jgi:hypothetical protein
MQAKFIQDFLNESVNSDKEKPLTSGEKAALTKGLSVITQSQLAALYLVAKRRLAKREDRSGNFAGKMAQRMGRNLAEEDFRDVTYGRLSDMLDMNTLTVSRTTNKFMLLLQGIEGTYAEIVYDKIIKAFEKFEKMQDGEVMGVAGEALNLDADTTREDEYSGKLSAQAKAAKKAEENKRFAIRDTFMKLKQHFDPFKAAKMAAASLSVKFKMQPDDIKRLAKIEFKNDPVMLKYWK